MEIKLYSSLFEKGCYNLGKKYCTLKYFEHTRPMQKIQQNYAKAKASRASTLSVHLGNTGYRRKKPKSLDFTDGSCCHSGTKDSGS